MYENKSEDTIIRESLTEREAQEVHTNSRILPFLLAENSQDLQGLDSEQNGCSFL